MYAQIRLPMIIILFNLLWIGWSYWFCHLRCKPVLYLAPIGWTDKFDRKYFVVHKFIILWEQINKVFTEWYPCLLLHFSSSTLSVASWSSIKIKIGATVPFWQCWCCCQLLTNGIGGLPPFFFSKSTHNIETKTEINFNPFWVWQSKSSLCLISKPKATINYQNLWDSQLQWDQ